MSEIKAHFHLPGLFEFYPFYQVFLPLFYSHREYFYSWCDIGSIYGSPKNCLWSGGRVEESDVDDSNVFSLMEKYSISLRLTFSNSLLKKEHLLDERCNLLCKRLEKSKNYNVLIIASDLLLDYLKKNYPSLYFVSSTTKVLTDFDLLKKELDDENYQYVVPDFRFNKDFAHLLSLSDDEKKKVEFLCNECCPVTCQMRKQCYENVSRLNLGIDTIDYVCPNGKRNGGYRFSSAMENPAFISVDDIKNIYLPHGFTNFKIEGRGLGSALLLEFLLYYMTKPEYQLKVREEIYLENTLDLF